MESAGRDGAVTGKADPWASLEAAFEPRALLRAAGFTAMVIGLAAFAGWLFSWLLCGLRWLDPEGFGELFSIVTPAACGWTVFLVVAVALGVAVRGGRHR